MIQTRLFFVLQISICASRIFKTLKETLDKIKEAHNNPEYKSIAAALEFIELAENSPSEEELRDQIQQDEKNWHAHYQLAAINLVRGDAVFALDTLLEIVRQDRTFMTMPEDVD